MGDFPQLPRTGMVASPRPLHRKAANAHDLAGVRLRSRYRTLYGA